jgi:hypothetical protein
MSITQGSHVTISIPGGDTFEAIVLEVRSNEIVAQEKGTKRAEVFPLTYVR